MPAALKSFCTDAMGPKMTVVPLSVMISALASMTLPLKAISPLSVHSPEIGAVLNAPLNRLVSTSPKYCVPVLFASKASPKRHEGRAPLLQRFANQLGAERELPEAPAKPIKPSWGKAVGVVEVFTKPRV